MKENIPGYPGYHSINLVLDGITTTLSRFIETQKLPGLRISYYNI